jgi:hypothetical protein
MKTHRFDSLSFLSGLVMTLIGLAFLIPRDPGDVFSVFGDIGNWFWPAVFLAIGIAVLAPLVAGMSGQDPETDRDD